MRYLIFNAAVILALAYLFMTEKEGLEVAAFDRDGAGVETAAAQGEAGEIRSAGEAAAPDVLTSASLEGIAEELQAPPFPDVPQIDRAEDLGREPRRESPPVSPAEGANVELQLPEVSDPQVARRRAEVLDGLELDRSYGEEAVNAAEAPAAKVVLADGQALMPTEERRKQLLSLAEEMELFFVEKLAN